MNAAMKTGAGKCDFKRPRRLLKSESFKATSRSDLYKIIYCLAVILAFVNAIVPIIIVKNDKIETMEIDNTITPYADESKAFWDNIRDNSLDYNSGADWFKEARTCRLSRVQKQNDTVITPTKVIKQPRKIANWKDPGLHGLQEFWLKFYVMHRKNSLATVRLLDYKPNS